MENELSFKYPWMRVPFSDQQEIVDESLVLAVSELTDILGKRLSPGKNKEKNNILNRMGKK